MAPVAKRFTISDAGSTSSIEIGGTFLKSHNPLIVLSFLVSESTYFANSSYVSQLFDLTACCREDIVFGFHI